MPEAPEVRYLSEILQSELQGMDVIATTFQRWASPPCLQQYGIGCQFRSHGKHLVIEATALHQECAPPRCAGATQATQPEPDNDTEAVSDTPSSQEALPQLQWWVHFGLSGRLFSAAWKSRDRNLAYANKHAFTHEWIFVNPADGSRVAVVWRMREDHLPVYGDVTTAPPMPPLGPDVFAERDAVRTAWLKLCGLHTQSSCKQAIRPVLVVPQPQCD